MRLLDLLPFSSVVALNRVLGSLNRLLDFGIDVADHFCEMVNEVLFVFSLILISAGVVHELLFEVVVMTRLAGPSVMSSVRE